MKSFNEWLKIRESFSNKDIEQLKRMGLNKKYQKFGKDIWRGDEVGHWDDFGQPEKVAHSYNRLKGNYNDEPNEPKIQRDKENQEIFKQLDTDVFPKNSKLKNSRGKF